MVDWAVWVREMLPHYIVMIFLILIALQLSDWLEMGLSGIPRLVLAVIVALAYPFVARWLGIAPEAWEPD